MRFQSSALAQMMVTNGISLNSSPETCFSVGFKCTERQYRCHIRTAESNSKLRSLSKAKHDAAMENTDSVLGPVLELLTRNLEQQLHFHKGSNMFNNSHSVQS